MSDKEILPYVTFSRSPQKIFKNYLLLLGFISHCEIKMICRLLSLRATRETAENKLMDVKFKNGSFIIRSPTEFDYSDALVICVKLVHSCLNKNSISKMHRSVVSDLSGTTVQRYLITRDNGKFALASNNNEERQFASLNELVKYYTRMLFILFSNQILLQAILSTSLYRVSHIQ